MRNDPFVEMFSQMNPAVVMHSHDNFDGSGFTQRVGECQNTLDRLSEVRSQHTGGAQFLFCDGTVRFISN